MKQTQMSIYKQSVKCSSVFVVCCVKCISISTEIYLNLNQQRKHCNFNRKIFRFKQKEKTLQKESETLFWVLVMVWRYLLVTREGRRKNNVCINQKDNCVSKNTTFLFQLEKLNFWEKKKTKHFVPVGKTRRRRQRSLCTTWLRRRRILRYFYFHHHDHDVYHDDHDDNDDDENDHNDHDD